MTSDTPRDWRGIPITPGARVIYGAGVGRSIALVEGTVDTDTPFTKSGRVNVRVIRRAYGGGWYDPKPVVHVGRDRLTVVELPPSTEPTEAEKAAESERHAALFTQGVSDD